MTPGIASNLPAYIRENYTVFELHHASAILATEFKPQFTDLLAALGEFRFKRSQITAGGGSESAIPKTMSALLRPRGWEERKLKASTAVDEETVRSDSHWIDYVKGRVAFDLEWNSKDQTFDRDLYAFRAFFDHDKISVGVLLTRGPELADLFRELGIQKKYGASTTHWGKLMPRLQSGRAGGCPILALGINRSLYVEDQVMLLPAPSQDLADRIQGRFSTILVDPPWRFQNRTGKMAPEHQRLMRYPTLEMEEIYELPVAQLAAAQSHLYLWVPNALLAHGLEAMKRWGFTYKTNLVWFKIRKDGGPDGRGVGFYFRNVTELVLFGVRGNIRTLPPGRRQVNLLRSQKREHSRKPDSLYDIIESCSPAPYLELFARHPRAGWRQWGNEVVEAHDRSSSRRVIPLYGTAKPSFRALQHQLFEKARRRKRA